MPDIIEIMKSVGAVMTDDHFVYTSGLHGEVYINKDALYPHTELTSQVGEMFAERHKDLDIETVVAPALGGIILSQWTAYHLSKMMGKEVFGIYTEKDENKNQILTRGYDKYVNNGQRTLVIEDLTNTGGSVKKATGANVVAACVMVNRDPGNVNSEMMGVPFTSLGELVAKAYKEDELPEEIANRPINTKVGHGRKYLEAKLKS
jgi:orotate phosphoribosyltransferase